METLTFQYFDGMPLILRCTAKTLNTHIFQIACLLTELDENKRSLGQLCESSEQISFNNSFAFMYRWNSVSGESSEETITRSVIRLQVLTLDRGRGS